MVEPHSVIGLYACCAGSNPAYPPLLGYGVMVTREILALKFKVRVLIAQLSFNFNK